MSRDLLLRLASLGFRIGLFLLALAGTFALVFGTPAAIKQALRDSNVYNAAAAIVQDQLAAVEITPAIKPSATTAATTAFPPSFVQSSAEEFIDGTYHWLDGSAKTPDFSIDLAPAVRQFTANVGDAAAKRAESLPVCGLSDRPLSAIPDTDILLLNCLPPGNTPAMIRSETIARLRESHPIIKNPVITAESLSASGQGPAFFESNSGAPGSYQMLVFLPWLLLLVCLGLASVALVIFQDKLKTVYELAKGLLWVGVIILIVTALAHVVFAVLTKEGGTIAASADGTYQQYILAFLRSLEGSLAKMLLVFGGAYTVAGGAIMAILHYTAGPPAAETAGASPETPETKAGSDQSDAERAGLTLPPRVEPAAPIGSTVTPGGSAQPSSQGTELPLPPRVEPAAPIGSTVTPTNSGQPPAAA